MMMKLTVDSGTFEVYQWKRLSEHEKMEKMKYSMTWQQTTSSKSEKRLPILQGNLY